jgi:Domain of unknown function (DUF4132)
MNMLDQPMDNSRGRTDAEAVPAAAGNSAQAMLASLERFASLTLREMGTSGAHLGQAAVAVAYDTAPALDDEQAARAAGALKSIIAKGYTDFEGLLPITLLVADGVTTALSELRRGLLLALMQQTAATDPAMPLARALNGIWISRGYLSPADLEDLKKTNRQLAAWAVRFTDLCQKIGPEAKRMAVIDIGSNGEAKAICAAAFQMTPQWRIVTPLERGALLCEFQIARKAVHWTADSLRDALVAATQKLWGEPLAFTDASAAGLLRSMINGHREWDSDVRVFELAEQTLVRGDMPETRVAARELIACMKRASPLECFGYVATLRKTWMKRLSVAVKASSEAVSGPTDDTAVLAYLRELAFDLLGASKPSAAWLKKAHALTRRLSDATRFAMLEAALADVASHPGDNSETLARALIYVSAEWPANHVGPVLSDFARKHCFLTVPGVGIKAERLGNACLWALIQMPDGAGVAHLARLLARIKYPKVKKKIEAALDEAAAAAGITRGELDELSVPTHDLDPAGTAEIAIGEGCARLAITGTRSVDIAWIASNGRQTASIPSAIKPHKAQIKAVRDRAKEIEADLGAQVLRLQQHYLGDRRWPADVWKSRYLLHPLMAALAHRLIWNITADGRRTAVVCVDGQLTDVMGKPVACVGEVAPWHPVTCPVEEVLAWRERLDTLGIVQPFKQAHREVYLVTDAERRTGVYSNRFAGHVLRQHQMMTLARINGWIVTHRIWADTSNDQPWHIVVPAFGLVAEFWTEGAGGQDNPEVTDQQAYVYVATDQLRFHRIDPVAAARATTARGPEKLEAVRIDAVPPIVLSEIMRHCDLFTGVASIGSDPAWQDGGAQAQHPSQWGRAAHQYARSMSTAELTGAGLIRRQVLERLVPRLAFASRCRLEDRYLRVEGTRRAYKIHLGSGNILMEPNDQYLCIVEQKGPVQNVRLPFEGDALLSVILSKAALLAADNEINDPSILSQIGRAN